MSTFWAKNSPRAALFQSGSESDSTTAAVFVPSDWSTFLISNGLSDLPYLYSIMLHLAELGLPSNFESVKKAISHLKAAIGCLVEVKWSPSINLFNIVIVLT